MRIDWTATVFDGKTLTVNKLNPARYRNGLGLDVNDNPIPAKAIHKEQGRTILDLVERLFQDPEFREWLKDQPDF